MIMEEDPRKTGLKFGLRQLTNEQIQRVLDYPNEMVLDTYNYHDGKFCPLAVAFDLPRLLRNDLEVSNENVQEILENLGLNIFNTRGIKGNFYTTDRKRDLLEAAREVLQERLEACSD